RGSRSTLANNRARIRHRRGAAGDADTIAKNCSLPDRAAVTDRAAVVEIDTVAVSADQSAAGVGNLQAAVPGADAVIGRGDDSAAVVERTRMREIDAVPVGGDRAAVVDAEAAVVAIFDTAIADLRDADAALVVEVQG